MKYIYALLVFPFAVFNNYEELDCYVYPNPYKSVTFGHIAMYYQKLEDINEPKDFYGRLSFWERVKTVYKWNIRFVKKVK